jgi:hypothetical protein
MRRCLLAVATCVAAAVAFRADAQITEVRAGSHIRLNAPGVVDVTFEAKVVQRTADSLMLVSSNGAPLAVWIPRIRSVDIGRRSRVTGALRGLGFGLPLGAALAWRSIATSDCNLAPECPAMKLQSAGKITLLWSVIGTATGALVGSEIWQPLELFDHASLDFDRGRPVLGVRLAL